VVLYNLVIARVRFVTFFNKKNVKGEYMFLSEKKLKETNHKNNYAKEILFTPIN
jgi:hypothetical protein